MIVKSQYPLNSEKFWIQCPLDLKLPYFFRGPNMMTILGDPSDVEQDAERRVLMDKPLLIGALWGRIKPPLPLPKPRRFRFPGRKPIDDRKALTGIIFVLKTGINWKDLPQE